MSTLSAALGPVESLVAVAGGGDLVTLTLRHASGATSTATLSQFAPPATVSYEGAVWGREGFSMLPARPENSHVDAMRIAAEELAAAARSGQPHEVDVTFGLRIVELLSDARPRWTHSEHRAQPAELRISARRSARETDHADRILRETVAHQEP